MSDYLEPILRDGLRDPRRTEAVARWLRRLRRWNRIWTVTFVIDAAAALAYALHWIGGNPLAAAAWYLFSLALFFGGRFLMRRRIQHELFRALTPR